MLDNLAPLDAAKLEFAVLGSAAAFVPAAEPELPVFPPELFAAVGAGVDWADC